MREIDDLRARVVALEQGALNQLQYWRPFPFHGQRGRLAIWEDIRTRWRPEHIVETGTHVGNSAEFFASVGVPLDTIEVDPTLYALASLRLRTERNVHLHLGDSADVLERLSVPDCHVFFYLDAHWKSRLPLRDELSVISRRWPNHVIQIDDFEVPGDPGYGFDDYGPDKCLKLSLIADMVDRWAVYFPALSSSEDTGTVRGCVVLATQPCLDDAPTLRRWTPQSPK